jgi:hypothetical protein
LDSSEGNSVRIVFGKNKEAASIIETASLNQVKP